jgi:hypothetical protein
MTKSTLENIILWTTDLPDWQAEAVRRLLLKAELTESDEDDIYRMLKAKHGLVKPENAPQFRPLDTKEFSGASSSAEAILLKEMKCIQGVNAIYSEKPLEFALKGLTIIYGDNATGKSGYARVLKKACRARDISEPILPNIFEADYIGPAKAHFVVLDENEKEKELIWTDEQDNLDVLSYISVYDAKCARIIVNQKNHVEFLPYGAYVFEALAQLVQRIKGKLEDESPKLEKPVIEELDIRSTSGIFLNSINISTKISDIEDKTKWNEEDQNKLDYISKTIISAEINNPLKQAETLEDLRNKILSLAKYLLRIRISLASTRYQHLNKLLAELKEAEKAREIASSISLSNEPIDGAGTKHWAILYNAAKVFSVNVAYPNSEFPNLENDARCVLCMQPISGEAKDRFKRFKAFMEDTTKKKVEKVENSINEFLKEIEQLKFYDREYINELLKDVNEFDAKLLDKIWNYLTSLIKIKTHFIQLAKRETTEPRPSYINCPKKEIWKIDKILVLKIDELKKSTQPEELERQKNEKHELESRKLLLTHTDNLKQYVKNLLLASLYENCIRETGTRSITTSGKKIISEALSPQLKSALYEELRLLNAQRFPIGIKITGGYGSTEHHLLLKGSISDVKHSLSQILSEGEQNVIAIAGFLAELQTAEAKNPIIFDDPVCSLDHRFRRAIARRMANIGLTRQVIVFTHDISFTLMLQEQCNVINCPCAIRSLERTQKKSGICCESPPWKTLNVKQCINKLYEELIRIRKILKEETESQYENAVRPFYDRLRETWEKLVEELLLNSVIYRFGREIQTQRLKRLTDIEDLDIKRINDAMIKCGIFMLGHDKAAALNEPVPEPDEIEQDIKNIDEYCGQLRKRKRSSR